MAQIALAVLLASGAGLLIRTVENLHAIDPSFSTERVAVIDATMPTGLSHDERRRVVLEALPSLQSLPNVTAAAAAMKLPLRGAGQDWGIRIEGRPDLADTTTYFRIVSHRYFASLGMEIRRGRGFEATDRQNTERVVVVNETLAAKYFPGEHPVGRVIHTGFDERGERVIGVVENVAEASLTDGPVAARYMLYDQVPFMWHEVSFVLTGKTAADLPLVLEAGRSALQRDAPQLAIQQTTTMGSLFEDALGPAGRLVTLLSLLAGLALVLGAVGVYGMISHFVSRRTREYGIRIAMGLPPPRVVSQVLGRGLRLVGAGSLIGIIAALVSTRLLGSLLYGVAASDPQALAGAVGALLIAGTIAALVPARRASRTDPAMVLREQ